MGVFPADCKNRFIDLNNQIRVKGAQYPFMITNTDSEDKRSTNWWSFLDTERMHSSYLIPSALSDYWVFLSKRSKWACNRSSKRKMKWLFWNGVSKGVTISVWLRKNSNSYRIRHSSSSVSWTSLGNTKELKTRSTCTSWTIACRASTLLIADLFNSISFWIYSNLWKRAWRLGSNQKNWIENSSTNY